METRDLSSIQGASGAAEEQSLNQAAPQAQAEELKANEPVAANPEAEAEDEMVNAIESEEAVDEAATETVTKDSLMAAARMMLEKAPADVQRDQISRLRLQYSALRKIETEADRNAWAEAGNDPAAFMPSVDADEAAFNDVINQVREKKNAWAAEQEAKRQENLAAKNDIINQINELAADTDNVNRTFPLYRDLQDRFNAIGEVPPTEETGVWKRFQEAREHYSDNLKINKELRDYDFKKNLDAKILLIEQAVALNNEEDVITAFRRLQDLHDKWRQVGPVAKELREEIWQKFKDASAVVNKKYQAFFEERKAREAQNEAAKTALCEQIEALDFNNLNSFNAWEQMTEQIIGLQNEWRKLGFASRKANNTLFARFRQRCDEFFAAKASYFKTVKEEYAANLAKKTALAERAEALKDSTDWRKATDEFVEMQKEWKTIGAVPKKHSDAVWKRFLGACDYFFDHKKQATSGQRTAELANLEAKRQIVADLETIAADSAAEGAQDRMRELQEKWQATGHVPFKEKDKINDAYRAAVNALRRAFNVSDNRARMDRFADNLAQLDGDNAKLARERERLARALESRRIEIRTYENNLGFLSSKSKSGETMVNEFRRKIDHLKDDIAQLEEKLRLIDSKMA